MKIGFDNDKYLRLQSENIDKRIAQFGGKLYLEFGGKLFDDYHASRVLPGFKPDSKLQLLLRLRERAEIVIVINSCDIANNKIRGDLGITYNLDVLRLIDSFRDVGLFVGSVVLTRFVFQPAAIAFQSKLESLGVKVYRHYPIEGYPNDVNLIVSDDGFGKNEYIETSRELVVVTAPGPGSGKMAVCLSQMYLDNKRGIKSGYAKFETFPIWNLPLKHPVNIAYEAATADLDDVNMIDPFHYEAYGEITVNYNRDVAVFPVLNAMLNQILGSSPYKSPTDMGVNMVGNCISDDEITCDAAKKEIVRRYYTALCDFKKNSSSEHIIQKIETLMKTAGISPSCRPVIAAALDKARVTESPAAAIELSDGTVITGKTSSLLGASSALLLNALKHLSGIPDDHELIAPSIIEPISHLKVDHLANQNPRLHIDELLIALAMCGVTSKEAELAMDQLHKLRGCDAHSSVILSPRDITTFKKLGINLTCEPNYEYKRLYNK